MSFIRPSARAALWKWREVLIGTGALVLALWWALQSFGVFRWIAIALVIAAALLVFAGVQRARFRGAGDGRGVVQVDERQITYFGPMSGGALSLAELGAISLNRSSRPAHWQLVDETGAVLSIPVDASGADGLFDAFAGLPGLRTEKMLQALNSPDQTGQIVIWRRADVQALIRQLH